MPKCRIGDLCFIIYDEDFKENTGKLVTVVGRPNADDFLFPTRRDDWEVEPHSPLIVYADTGKTNSYFTTRHVAIEDEFLFPLRDQPGVDQMLLIAGLPESLNLPQGEEA